MRFKDSFFILSFSLLTAGCTSQEPKPVEEQGFRPVPELRITAIDPTTWTEKNRCKVDYVLNGDTTTLTGRIKYRGGISSKYPKHSYSLELDSPFQFLDLKADDDWIINAGYVDKTFMRHKLSYDLFRSMHAENLAAECFYSMVNFNNHDRGLYVVMEEVNGSMLGVDKTDEMAMVFKGPAVFHETRLEYVQEPDNYYQQKYPKISVDDKTDLMEEFRSFLFETSDEDFAKGIGDWVDLRNVADWHLLLLFTNNSDGLMKNFYLYKLDSSTPFRFAPWDYDHSFGRDGDYELNKDTLLISINRNVLLRRLMETNAEEYRDKLKKRWAELTGKNKLTVESTFNIIRLNDRSIAEWIPKNREIWPDSSKFYFDDNAYDQEISIMKNYVEMRVKSLEVYLQSLD